MIQWIAAIEESKVDADMAYWNIDGNLNDSAVEANKATASGGCSTPTAQFTGTRSRSTPPFPNVSYTLQGVAALDRSQATGACCCFGGASGARTWSFTRVDAEIFGAHGPPAALEIPWTGQVGARPSR